MLQEPVHISQPAQLSLDIEGVDFIGRLLCATYSCSFGYRVHLFLTKLKGILGLLIDFIPVPSPPNIET